MPRILVRQSLLLTAYFATYAVASFLPIARTTYTEVTRMSMVCLLYSGWCIALERKGRHEEWPAIDAQTNSWITERYQRTETLYNQAGRFSLEGTRLEVSQTPPHRKGLAALVHSDGKEGRPSGGASVSVR